MAPKKKTKVRKLISEKKIRERVKELGKKISEDYAGKRPTILILANGGIFFGVDLLHAINGIEVKVECIRISSYKNGTTSSGKPEILGSLVADDFLGRDVLIVDDVIDTGRTLKRICEQLTHFGANSVKTCAFLNKPSRREVDFVADYVGYEIEDAFVVGYGLDFSGHYRELPFIGALFPTAKAGDNRGSLPLPPPL